jgi:hypothetical protein
MNMINGLCRITLPLVLIICSSSIARPQSCTPASSGLVSWWAGDTTENDIISGNNPSAVNAVTLMPAEVKDGFTFGTEGYIEIPGATNLANQNFTWAAWVNPAGPGPNNDSFGSVIAEKNIDDTDASFSLSWRATDGRFLFFFGYQYSESITSTDTFPAGSFYFVAATYDGSTFRLFVNGLPEGSFSESKTVTYTGSPWVIGSADPIYFPLGYYRTWNGVIDEVQAYNVALAQSQIQAIYAAGQAGVCKGLTFSPAGLTFPRQTIGTTSPAKAVTVTNPFPLPVTIKKIVSSGDFAQTNTCPVPPATLATGATCTAGVTFTPTAIGTRTGKLAFIDSAPASPQTVRLTGSATDIGLSKSLLSFASRKVGTTSAAKTVAVTNDGAVTVNFTGSGIVIAGSDPTDFIISANTCGPSIAAGGACTVSVEFKPMAKGTRSATLQFNDDGGASPQVVALVGNGT